MPRRMDPADPRLRALRVYLTTHHSVIDRRALREMGFDAEYGRDEVVAGRWQQVHPAICCTYTGPLTFLSRCEAAVRAVGHGAVLDGEAGLRVSRHLIADPVGPIDVSIPHGSARRAVDGVRVRQSASITERSWWMRDNLPTLRAEWAVVGAARRTPARARARIAEAVQSGWVLPAQLAAVLLAIGSFRGRPRLQAIVADVGGGSRYELEAVFFALCRRAGLPLPTRQHPLLLGTRRAWLDACWPDLRVAVEIDGAAYHVLSEDWHRDLARQNAIVLDGWTVLRFTARALREQPDVVIATVRAALNAARRRRDLAS